MGYCLLCFYVFLVFVFFEFTDTSEDVDHQVELPSSDVSDGSNLLNNSVVMEVVVADPSSFVVENLVASEDSPLVISSDAVVEVASGSNDLEVSVSQGLESAIDRGNDSHWLDYATLMGNTLPSKSKIIYLKAYGELENYLRKENQFVNGVVPSEHAMLNFFFYLKNDRQQAPSTIWCLCITLLFSFLFNF